MLRVDLESEFLGWYPRSTNFCFTSGRLLNLCVPQGPHPWNAREKSKCDVCQALPAVPVPRWGLSTCSLQLLLVGLHHFLLSQSLCCCGTAHCFSVFQGSRETVLSLPILVLKFEHQIPSLYIKAKTREQSHVVKITTHTTLRELRVPTSWKRGINQFPRK